MIRRFSRGGLLAGLALSVFTTSAAFGGTVSWDGGAGTDSWHDALNWSTDVVPGPTDDVLISGSASQVDYSTTDDPVASLTIQSSSTLTVTGGTFSVTGAFEASSATFAYEGGTIDADPALRNGTLRIGAGGNGSLDVIARGNSALVGELRSNQSIWVQGSNLGSTASLRVGDDASNAGTILLESVDSTFTSRISIATGETFVNRPTGVIISLVGTGGSRDVIGAGTLRNEGTIEVGLNVTLIQSSTGNVLEHAGGAITGEGEIVVSNGTLVYSGGEIDAALIARTSSINITPDVTAKVTVIAEGSCTLIDHGSPTVTLFVRGSAAGSTATLTADGSARIAGHVLVDAIDGAFQSRLNMPAGTSFTLETTGVIEARPTGGGARLINGNGTFFNQGRIEVDLGAELVVGTTNHSFQQLGGTIVAVGRFIARNGEFIFSGGRLEGQVIAQSQRIDVRETVSEPSTLIAWSTCDLVQNASEVVTIWAQASAIGSTSTLAIVDGAVNAGTIVMRAIDNGGTCRIRTPPGLVFTNDASGVIVVQRGAGGARQFTDGGDFDNLGLVRVEEFAQLNFTGPNAEIANVGTFRVDDRGEVLVSGSNIEFEQVDGTIDAVGPFVQSTGTFRLLGGELLGEVIARNSTIEVAETATVPSTLFAEGSCTASLLASPAITVVGRGSVRGSTMTLTTVDDLENACELVFTAIDSSLTSRISMPTNTTFVNGPAGRIRAELGTGGARQILGAGTFRNLGLVEVDPSVEFVQSGSNSVIEQMGGSIIAHGTFRKTSGDFVFGGGELEGNVETQSTMLTVLDTAVDPSTLVCRGTNTLVDNASPVVTLHALASAAGSTATLNTVEDTVNAGIILLDALDTAGTARINIPAGEVFTNGPTGTVRVIQGAAGARQINGEFVNEGRLDAGRTIDLDLNGNYTQTETGTFVATFETIFSKFTETDVSQTATLAGTIELVTLPTFEPPPGSEYVVIDAAEIIGQFDAVTSCQGLNVSYTADQVIVTFFEFSGVLGDLTGDGEVDTQDLLVLLSTWGACPDPGEEPCCPGDLNDDGLVGTADLLVLLAAWTG